MSRATKTYAGSGHSDEEIRRLGPWFHNLHLPDGRTTAPEHFLGDFPSYKWRELAPHIPADLRGWRVLDIGCNAGFYSFELARRGAHVLGIDHDETYLRQAEWALDVFKMRDRVRFANMQVYDLHRLPETFDLVLFMGVFYHLRYPLLGLDLVAEKVRRLLVFQTLSMPGERAMEPAEDYAILDREPMLEEGWPKMAFIEKCLAGDPTNWWAPNHAAIEAMLRSTGMRVLSRPLHEVYICEPGESTAVAARAWAQGQRASGAAAAERVRPR